MEVDEDLLYSDYIEKQRRGGLFKKWSKRKLELRKDCVEYFKKDSKQFYIKRNSFQLEEVLNVRLVNERSWYKKGEKLKEFRIYTVEGLLCFRSGAENARLWVERINRTKDVVESRKKRSTVARSCSIAPAVITNYPGTISRASAPARKAELQREEWSAPCNIKPKAATTREPRRSQRPALQDTYWNKNNKSMQKKQAQIIEEEEEEEGINTNTEFKETNNIYSRYNAGHPNADTEKIRKNLEKCNKTVAGNQDTDSTMTTKTGHTFISDYAYNDLLQNLDDLEPQPPLEDNVNKDSDSEDLSGSSDSTDIPRREWYRGRGAANSGIDPPKRNTTAAVERPLRKKVTNPGLVYSQNFGISLPDSLLDQQGNYGGLPGQEVPQHMRRIHSPIPATPRKAVETTTESDAYSVLPNKEELRRRSRAASLPTNQRRPYMAPPNRPVPRPNRLSPLRANRQEQTTLTPNRTSGGRPTRAVTPPRRGAVPTAHGFSIPGQRHHHLRSSPEYNALPESPTTVRRFPTGPNLKLPQIK